MSYTINYFDCQTHTNQLLIKKEGDKMEAVKTIKVLGKGNVTCPPDTVVLSFKIESKSGDYASCLKDLNSRTDDLRSSVRDVTDGKGVLKTADYSIRTESKYEKGHSVFIGYSASHRLQIEFPVDTSLLNRVLNAIAKGYSGAEIRISFTVKNKDALKKRVLQDAVRVAKQNASTIAEAAGVKLGELQYIDYSWSEVRISQREYDICESPAADNDADIDPEDVQADDSVTLVYAIGK